MNSMTAVDGRGQQHDAGSLPAADAAAGRRAAHGNRAPGRERPRGMVNQPRAAHRRSVGVDGPAVARAARRLHRARRAPPGRAGCVAALDRRRRRAQARRAARCRSAPPAAPARRARSPTTSSRSRDRRRRHGQPASTPRRSRSSPPSATTWNDGVARLPPARQGVHAGARPGLPDRARGRAASSSTTAPPRRASVKLCENPGRRLRPGAPPRRITRPRPVVGASSRVAVDGGSSPPREVRVGSTCRLGAAVGVVQVTTSQPLDVAGVRSRPCWPRRGCWPCSLARDRTKSPVDWAGLNTSNGRDTAVSSGCR